MTAPLVSPSAFCRPSVLARRNGQDRSLRRRTPDMGAPGRSLGREPEARRERSRPLRSHHLPPSAGLHFLPGGTVKTIPSWIPVCRPPFSGPTPRYSPLSQGTGHRSIETARYQKVFSDPKCLIPRRPAAKATEGGPHICCTRIPKGATRSSRPIFPQQARSRFTLQGPSSSSGSGAKCRGNPLLSAVG